MSMEDARITNLDIDSIACFGVFDGHGGREVSIFASKHFCDELRQNSNFRTGKYEQALIDTFLRIDELLKTPEALLELYCTVKDLTSCSRIDPNFKVAAGCTAVVALITEATVIIANAGDSRCVLARRGTALALTTDHKPEVAEEHSRIKRAGGYVEMGRVNGNLNLTRSLGDFDYKGNSNISPQEQIITAYPDTTTVELTPDDDFLVLACDGVWDMLSNQECVDFIYERLDSTPLEQIAEQLLDRCLAPSTQSHAGLGCDNTTAIIVKFKR
jgi:serine/threonine protein phosphatase PrpC